MRAVALRALLLFNLALTLALGYGRLAHPELSILQPLTGNSHPSLRFISPEETWSLLQQDKAVIVDARAEEMFHYGRLPEAVSLPSDTEVPPELLERLRQAAPVIVYCDGPHCQAAETVALHLIELGLSNVMVMREGWEGWIDSGKPVQLGDR